MDIFDRSEKRLNVRKAWRSKIVFEDEFGKGLIYLYSQDISLGGLYLENPPPIQSGAHLLLSFILPGKKRPLRITGQIVRFVEHGLDPSEQVRKGAGVRFVDVDTESRQQLAIFINEK